MKIALQISGRLRFTENSLNSLIGAIIEPLQPDIFFSFWEPENVATLYFYRQSLNPKMIEIENQTMIKPYLDDLFPFDVHKNMPSMSYKFYRVKELRKTWEMMKGESYDLIIQARSDNIFFEKLDLERCQCAIDQNAILCTNQVYNASIDNYIPPPRMVDNFYLGPTILMDRANDVFWNLRGLAQNYTARGDLHQVRIPEIIQTNAWREANIPIKSLTGTGGSGEFWYDIDRTESKWK